MTSVGGSIANTLGIGSGLDSSGIVDKLVAAVRGPKETAITSRQTTNNTRISALASATSSLSTFSKALSDLLSGTGFSGTPQSNDNSIAAVSLLPGGVPSGLPAQIEVKQLATAQTAESPTVASKTAIVGIGTLKLSSGGTDYSIEITSANNTLQGLADAINGKGAGVSAAVVTDNNGARIVLKGKTGEANTFTLTDGNPGVTSSDLLRFTDAGNGADKMTQKVAAQDSLIEIDGIAMKNSSNTVDTAIPYVRIDLNKAQPGTLVTLGSSEPTNSVRDLVTEFVAAYNTLKSALNGATATGTDSTNAGALAGDAGVREMTRQLSRLTSSQLISTGAYKTLADIGVSTNRDGTLSVDTKQLDKVIAADPTQITQMLNPAVSGVDNPGLAGAMKKVSDALQATDGPLDASKKKFTALQESLAKQLEKLNTDMDDYEARTAAIFSAMDTKLAGLKATQTYLTQQIAAWNSSK